MACKRNNPGQPCCCFKLEELPEVSIEGMHVSVPWAINLSSGFCCATITLEYDTPPAFTYVNAGNVMTFDKTQTIVREHYYSGHYPLIPNFNPRQCGQVLIGHYMPPDSGGDPGYTNIPIEPAYTNCCADVQVVNTRSTTTWDRGGQELLVKYRPESIQISVQLRSTNCTDRTPAIDRRYVVTSRKFYEARYAYNDYRQITTTITNTSTQPCWGGNTTVTVGNASNGSSPWSGGTRYGAEYCRRLIIDQLDWPDATSFEFAADSVSTGCTVLDPDCDICGVYATQICLNSAPTITEPEFGFCTPLTIGTRNWHSHRKTCLKHQYAMYDDSTGLFMYCSTWSPTLWDLITCDIVFSAIECGITGVSDTEGYGPGCGGGPYPDFAGACEVLTFSCPNCPPPGTSVVAVVATFECRIKSCAETLSCSGYTPRSACFSFEGWTVAVVMP